MADRQSRTSPPDDWLSPARRACPPFLALCGVGFLGRLSFEMLRTPLTPIYAKHLGAPDQYIGLLVAAVTIAGVIVKLPAGALSDVLGFRRLMIAGAFIIASGPFVYFLAISWPILLAVRFYHGLATAIYAPPASALVAKVYPIRRGHRLGLYSGAENAGEVLGPVMGGLLISLTATNFSLIFIISGIVGVLCLLALLGVPETSKTPSPLHPGQDVQLRTIFTSLKSGIHEIFADKQIRLVSLVEAGLCMGVGSLQAYLPLYALTIRLPVWQIGMLYGASGITSVLSRPITGWCSDRLGSRKSLIIAGSLLCIGSLITIPHVAGFIGLLGLSVIFGLGTGIVTPSTMAMIGDLVTKENYGAAMGVFGSLWDAGHAGGPVVFGFLLVAFGYQTSWLIVALIMTTILVIFLVGADRKPSSRLEDRMGCA